VTGRGIAVVTATGMNTELGKIASLLQGVKNQPTSLQQRLTQLGNVLVAGALAIVALTIIGGMLPDLLRGSFDLATFRIAIYHVGCSIESASVMYDFVSTETSAAMPRYSIRLRQSRLTMTPRSGQ
jgi:magnesium-transporting ATPase (P-type)